MITKTEYKYGFSSDIASDTFEKGLSKDVIIAISKKRKEPKFILDFRLDAYDKFKKMELPTWANLQFEPIDFQNISYYSEPILDKKNKKIDPEVKKTFDKLGVPTEEKDDIAVDVVFDSISVATTYKKRLQKYGVVLCPISEAVIKYPDIVKKYLGTVVPSNDNYYAALNSAVFSDGSFVYVPKGVKCPLELSTYFRINARSSGQFERTLIIAEEGSSVSYLEGCTAPAYDENQLHAAIVEIVALDEAKVKYSTVQNWYGGDPKTGKGGIFNFVTKRGLCKGNNSKISWTQVELGSAITWKYPSCILLGDGSQGEFYSIALTGGHMQADTGTKMIHIGKNTTSTIISKGISTDYSHNSYRGLVKMADSADNARNYTQCDSMLVGDNCSACTFPYIEGRNMTSQVEHEASTSKMNEEQIFYLQARGISREDAINMVVNGFCKEVIKELPLEFSVEARELLSYKLEKAIG